MLIEKEAQVPRLGGRLEQLRIRSTLLVRDKYVSRI